MAIAVVTGAGAGVGRATARELARAGYDVGLIGRDRARLDAAAAEVRAYGMRAAVATADVADPAALDAAADTIERDLGPIDAWINNAMAAVFAPVVRTEPAEFRRGTEVTYLGTVHGTMSALKRMRRRDQGTIVNVGSALAYRSVPLQAVASGAKSAVRGFTDALRSELLHDGSRIKVGMVHLPAINTPQFDWLLNRMGRRARPVAPIYQPEVAARAIVFAVQHPRRDIWIGFSTVLAIIGNRLIPGLLDRALAHFGYGGQLSDERLPPESMSNLDRPVPGAFGAHGRFDREARESSWEMVTSRHRDALVALGFVGAIAGLRMLARGRRRRATPRAVNRQLNRTIAKI